MPSGKGLDLRRLARIARVAGLHLAAHAWGERLLRRAPSLARRLPQVGTSGPDRLRLALEELGGTFIKLGQMLALQPDILSLEYCNALFKLLDQVEPFPYADVERTFREELGCAPDEVFDRFEHDSFAAASIGQVHRATRDGRALAVKVRRPSVERDFAGDLRLMSAGIGVVRTLRIRRLFWLIEPVSEFIAWTREELDYRNEARYMDRLRTNAAGNPKERVPEVLWELSGPRILVLDYLDGVPVIDYVRALETGDELTPRRLSSAGFDPDAFARAIIENFLGDAFRHGLFHADLHPANLLILPDNVVGYVDFGITGVLSPYSRRHLVAMTLAYARADLDGMCRAFFHVSSFAPGADPAAFRSGLGLLSRGWYAGDGRQRRLSTNFTRVMLDMLRLSRGTGIWPERDVVKYIRSAIAIDGLITRFAPGFDVGFHLEALSDRHLRWQALGQVFRRERLMGSSVSGSRLVLEGVARSKQVFDRFLAGEVPLAVELDEPRREPPGRTRPDRALGAVAALLVLALALGQVFEPTAAGWNPFTAGTVTVATGLVCLLPALWRLV